MTPQPPTPGAPALIWIDLETTGLDYDTAYLLEVAAIVTDSDLRPIGGPFAALIQPPLEVLEALNGSMESHLVPPEVVDMHRESGLTDELWEARLERRQRSPVEVEARILAYLLDVSEDLDPLPLAGSSVHFDREMIRRHLPAVHRRVHRRNVDVSGLKELNKLWGFAPPWKGIDGNGTKAHRALADISESIAELAHYRDHGLRWRKAAA